MRTIARASTAFALAAILIPGFSSAQQGPTAPTTPAENFQRSSVGGASSVMNPSDLIGDPPASKSSSSPDAPIAPGAEITLKQAIDIALRFHPKVQESHSETNAAEQQVGQARSYLGPQVYGATEYLRSTENGIGNTSYYSPNGIFPRMTGRNHDFPSNDFSQSSDTSDNFGGGIGVSQFLFDFGRRHGFVSERQYEHRAAAAQERLTQLDIIYEVTQRYFDLLEAKQLIRVYEKAVEQRQYHLHEARVKAEAGLRPQLDTYVTQAEVQRAQLNLVDARINLADAKVALDNALGLSDNAPPFELVEVLTYSPVTEKYRDLLRTAFALRPDLRALDDRAKAMGAQIVEYNSDYYPTVSAVGGYAALGTGLPMANNFNVGVLITWPIFNSFLTRDQIAEAKYRQDAIRHGIEDLRQRIIFEVHTAFLNWQASLQRIERAEKALVASRAELELADKRYESGLANIVELEDAQRHYTYDDAAYANALYGYSVAKAAVDRATARSLPGS